MDDGTLTWPMYLLWVLFEIGTFTLIIVSYKQRYKETFEFSLALFLIGLSPMGMILGGVCLIGGFIMSIVWGLDKLTTKLFGKRFGNVKE